MSPGPAAAAIAIGVERIIAAYEQLLEIRKLRTDLEEKGGGGDGLAGVEDHANEVMEEAITGAVEALVSRFSASTDQGRTNELRIELTTTLNAVANRIDRGYNIEVRAGPIKEPAEADDAEPLEVRGGEGVGGTGPNNRRAARCNAVHQPHRVADPEPQRRRTQWWRGREASAGVGTSATTSCCRIVRSPWMSSRYSTAPSAPTSTCWRERECQLYSAGLLSRICQGNSNPRPQTRADEIHMQALESGLDLR